VDDAHHRRRPAHLRAEQGRGHDVTRQ
jgi:hypothetical protein